MNGSAKVILSPEELARVTDTEWLASKHIILGKIEKLFAQMITPIEDLFKNAAGELNLSPPKISRGENYKGFPFLVLDHPRMFTAESIFAIRTMFWWGHHLAVTLHLSGDANKLFTERISAKPLETSVLFVASGTDEWDHDIYGGGYTKLESTAQLAGRNFNKIAAGMKLDTLNDAPQFLIGSYRTIEGLL